MRVKKPYRRLVCTWANTLAYYAKVLKIKIGLASTLLLFFAKKIGKSKNEYTVGYKMVIVAKQCRPQSILVI